MVPISYLGPLCNTTSRYNQNHDSNFLPRKTNPLLRLHNRVDVESAGPISDRFDLRLSCASTLCISRLHFFQCNIGRASGLFSGQIYKDY